MSSISQVNLSHVTESTFESEVVESKLPVIVDFWAPWCAPCRAIGPVLSQLAKEWEGRVKVVKVNIDDEPALASAFQVRSIPTLAVLSGREVVDSMVGFSGPQALRQLFVRHAAPEAVAQAAS